MILMSLINTLQYLCWRLPRAPNQGQSTTAAGIWYIYVIRNNALKKIAVAGSVHSLLHPPQRDFFSAWVGGTCLQNWNLIRLRMPERKYFYFLYHGYCYYFVSVSFSLREWNIKLSLVEVLPSLFWISYSTPALQHLLHFLQASSCTRQHVFQAACNCRWNSHTLVKY